MPELVERPKLVKDKFKLLKKAKKINSNVEVISQVPNESGGCTPGGFGVTADTDVSGVDTVNDNDLISKAVSISSNMNEYKYKNLKTEINAKIKLLKYLKSNTKNKYNIDEIDLLLKKYTAIDEILKKHDDNLNEELSEEEQKNINEIFNSEGIGLVSSIQVLLAKNTKSIIPNLDDLAEKLGIQVDDLSFLKKEERRFILCAKSGLNDDISIKFVNAVKGTKLLDTKNLKSVQEQLNSAWKNLYSIDSDSASKLAAYSDVGLGKGENFIEFVFDNVNVAGGSASYDIIVDNNESSAFEVKCYESTNSEIRLGTQGAIGRFKGYDVLIKVYNAINEFINIDSKSLNIFVAMLSNAHAIKIKNNKTVRLTDKTPDEIMATLKGVFKKFESSYKSKNIQDDHTYTYADRLKAGELNRKDCDSIQEVLDTFSDVSNAIINNEFEYAKLVKKGDVFVVVSDEDGEIIVVDDSNDDKYKYIKCWKAATDDWKKIDEHTKKIVFNMKQSIDEAKDAYGSEKQNGEKTTEGFYNNMFDEVSNEISDYIAKHPIIMINSKQSDRFVAKSNESFCFGIYTKAVVSSISQGKFKVLVVDGTNKDIEIELKD